MDFIVFQFHYFGYFIILGQVGVSFHFIAALAIFRFYFIPLDRYFITFLNDVLIIDHMIDDVLIIAHMIDDVPIIDHIINFELCSNYRTHIIDCGFHSYFIACQVYFISLFSMQHFILA